MLKKSIALIIPLMIIVLLAQIPMFPLVGEMRSYSADGESLSQVLQFVSMPEFYSVARYVRVAWLDSTLYIYIALLILNHGILFVIFLGSMKLLNKIWK